MTFVPVAAFCSANDKTAGTTISALASATVEVGNLAVVWSAWDNEGAADADTAQLSCSDTAGGNTWVKLFERTKGSGGANAGVTLACFICKVSTEIQSGIHSIVITSTTSRTASVVRGWEFTTAAGVTVSLAPGTNYAQSGAASGQPGAIATSGLPSEPHLHLYGFANEGTQAISGYDVLTDGGQDGTSGGGTNTNISLDVSFHIGTNTGLSVDTTATSGSNFVQALVALREVAIATPTDKYGSICGTFKCGTRKVGEIFWPFNKPKLDLVPRTFQLLTVPPVNVFPLKPSLDLVPRAFTVGIGQSPQFNRPVLDLLPRAAVAFDISTVPMGKPDLDLVPRAFILTLSSTLPLNRPVLELVPRRARVSIPQLSPSVPADVTLTPVVPEDGSLLLAPVVIETGLLTPTNEVLG